MAVACACIACRCPAVSLCTPGNRMCEFYHLTGKILKIKTNRAVLREIRVVKLNIFMNLV
jgi:hypothetical protein